MTTARESAASGGRPRVPGLVVADRIQPMSEVLDPLASDVEVCRDARGDLLAYCRAVDGSLLVDMPELASFSHVPGAGHVLAVPHRSLPPAFILDTYRHCVLPLILPALGTQVLHASAVAGTDGVAAFCAASGTGKSTIAVALARRGYAVWADDAVAVDLAPSRPVAIPLPFAVRLRSDSARFLGCEPGEPVPAAPMHAGSLPLAVLCLLERKRDTEPAVEVERLDVAAACRAALAHAYCFSVKDAAQKRRTVLDHLTLGTRVPAYEIRFPAGLGRLSLILDAVEEIMSGVSMDAR